MSIPLSWMNVEFFDELQLVSVLISFGSFSKLYKGIAVTEKSLIDIVPNKT